MDHVDGGATMQLATELGTCPRAIETMGFGMHPPDMAEAQALRNVLCRVIPDAADDGRFRPHPGHSSFDPPVLKAAVEVASSLDLTCSGRRSITVAGFGIFATCP